MNQAPEFLYRYARINEHLFQLLTLNQIHFSRFEDFNDPFDCGIVPNFEPPDNKVEKQYVDQLLRPNPHYKDLVRRIDNEGFTTVMRTGYEQQFLAMKEDVRVLCLSAIGNNSLMFSHYGDKHRGVCLKFNTSLIPYKENLKPVSYVERVPSIPLLGKKDPKEDYDRKVVLHYYTKSRDWEHEKEWRVTIRNDDVGKYFFPPEMLSGVIFGYKTTDSNRLAITNLLNTMKRNITFQKVVGIKHDFTLDIADA